MVPLSTPLSSVRAVQQAHALVLAYHCFVRGAITVPLIECDKVIQQHLPVSPVHALFFISKIIRCTMLTS